MFPSRPGGVMSRLPPGGVPPAWSCRPARAARQRGCLIPVRKVSIGLEDRTPQAPDLLQQLNLGVRCRIMVTCLTGLPLG